MLQAGDLLSENLQTWCCSCVGWQVHIQAQIINRYDVCRLTANALSHTTTSGNTISSFKRTVSRVWPGVDKDSQVSRVWPGV